MDWTQFITVFAIIGTNLGTVIALYLQTDRKIEDHRKETNSILEAIRQDMKEFHKEIMGFHGRMERLDTEFKAHIMHMHKNYKYE